MLSSTSAAQDQDVTRLVLLPAVKQLANQSLLNQLMGNELKIETLIFGVWQISLHLPESVQECLPSLVSVFGKLDGLAQKDSIKCQLYQLISQCQSEDVGLMMFNQICNDLKGSQQVAQAALECAEFLYQDQMLDAVYQKVNLTRQLDEQQATELLRSADLAEVHRAITWFHKHPENSQKISPVLRYILQQVLKKQVDPEYEVDGLPLAYTVEQLLSLYEPDPQESSQMAQFHIDYISMRLPQDSMDLQGFDQYALCKFLKTGKVDEKGLKSYVDESLDINVKLMFYSNCVGCYPSDVSALIQLDCRQASLVFMNHIGREGLTVQFIIQGLQNPQVYENMDIKVVNLALQQVQNYNLIEVVELLRYESIQLTAIELVNRKNWNRQDLLFIADRALQQVSKLSKYYDEVVLMLYQIQESVGQSLKLPARPVSRSFSSVDRSRVADYKAYLKPVQQVEVTQQGKWSVEGYSK